MPSTRTASCGSCSSRRPRRAPPSCGCASTSAKSKSSASGSSPSSATGSWSASPKARRLTTSSTTASSRPTLEEGYSSDGRVAFFAKGRVKGSTLLTIAFDSERDRPLVEDRLFGTIEPDRYYTLYGDAVEQRFEAATTRKLYLKIERRQFAALFGDFETGFSVTELGRYSRSLTGFKADYGGDRFGVSAFAAENRERYGRDELPGDGTSGPYRLSRTALVANSDRLTIEVRDRVRSEVVVDSRVLTRFIDYSLDYFTGELLFKQPIPSRDSAFNPVYIIAEYETLDSAAGGTTAGARTTARLAGDKLELGATLINEGADVGDTRLAATDLRFRPMGALELRAEIAQTTSDDPLRAGNASAYLAEVEHVTERLDLQAYVREQEAGFGVGQQLSTETGTRKIGLDARTELTQRWTARGEAFQQTNLQTGADRELVSAEARRETDDATASVGVRRVVDDLPQTGVQRSELMSVGGSLDVLRDRVTLRALTEQALGGPAASLDFPERTTLGLDYHLSACDDAVRRGRGCRRRADRLDDDARRRAQHAVVRIAAVVEREPRVQRVRPARVREPPVSRRASRSAQPGRWTSASTAATR